MTRFVAFAPVLLLVACFGSHGSGDGPTDDGPPLFDGGPARILDGGRPIAPDAGPDSGSEPDGGLPPTCSPHRASVSCGGAPAPSGIPFQLPVSIGGQNECFCGETVHCDVALRRGTTGAEVELELNTALCADGALCDACFPYVEGTCNIRPLDGGIYPVWLNGERAFDLHVEEGDFGRQLQCTRVAAPDPLDCGPVGWPPHPFEPSEVCHAEAIFAGTRGTITVVDDCASCGQQPGPCTVTLDESGFAPVLQVEATRTYTECDIDCPEICMRMEQQCVIPDTLPTETIYQVIVNGRNFGTRLAVGSFTGGEVCAGSAIGG